MVLVWSISWAHSQEVGWACSHLKAGLGLEEPFPKWLTELWMGVLHFSACGPLSLLTTWWLTSFRDSAQRELQCPLSFNLGSYTLSLLPHSVRSQSLSSAHIQREGNLSPPFEGNSTRNWWNMLKTPCEVSSQPWVWLRGWSSTSRPSLSINLQLHVAQNETWLFLSKDSPHLS